MLGPHGAPSPRLRSLGRDGPAVVVANATVPWLLEPVGVVQWLCHYLSLMMVDDR